jgi:hypothetical protein
MALPQAFALKANHGSGMTCIVLDKDKADYEIVRRKAHDWLSTDYSWRCREWVYHQLPRLLVIEELLDFGAQQVPLDFKFFCIHGRVELLVVDFDRFSGHKRDLYDREFHRLDAEHMAFPAGPGMEKPAMYERAVGIAEALAAPFDVIRVDLYLSEQEVYFGELTMFPEAGMGRFRPRSIDFQLGAKLRLLHETVC